MRRPPRVRVLTLRATFTLFAVCAAIACSGGPEAVPAANAPFAIQVSQTYVTVENRTGAPVVGGQMEIIPGGILPRFKTALPRLEAGSKRDVMLNTFKDPGGTPFNRAIARARSMKVTAKDQLGKVYEFEAPFN